MWELFCWRRFSTYMICGLSLSGTLYVFPWTTSLDFSLFVTSCCWVCEIQSYVIFLRCSWNIGQSFGSHWISFSTRALYLLSWLIGSALHATEVKVFSPYRTLQLSLLPRRSHSSCVLLQVFLFYRCHTILGKSDSLVSNSDIFFSFEHSSSMWSGSFLPHFCTCRSALASLPVMFRFLIFETSQGCWDILFQPTWGNSWSSFLWKYGAE